LKIVHIFSNTSENFSAPYIKFVNQYFDAGQHLFYILGKDLRSEDKIQERANVIYQSHMLRGNFIHQIYQADKIIIHSLTIPKFVLFLFLQPWLRKKCIWVIWGGDLYSHLYMQKKLKYCLYDYIKGRTVRTMSGIATLVENDYILAQKWYGVKGNYYNAVYMNEAQHEYVLKLLEKKGKFVPKIQTRILIGNSATASNCHIEVLDKLKKFKNEEIEIICPLSYGDKAYAEKVIAYGQRIFGRNFCPLLDLLEQNDYIDVLDSVDIGIFNNNRQQALGNIYVLLELGKKVYLRKDTSMWSRMVKVLDEKIFDVSEIESMGFKDFIFMEESDKLKNIQNMKNFNSTENIKNIWEKVFWGK